MGPKGNPTSLPRATCCAEKLEEEPDTDKEECRHLHKREEEKEGYQGQYPRPGIEYQVCPHHACNGAAGTDGGDVRVPVEQEMRGPCSQTAYQIEEEIAEMSQSVFNIVPKDIEEPHIAHEVKDPAV